MLKKIMVAQLARILEEWHCNSFTDLIDEMELWERGKQDFWSRLAQLLHSQSLSITWTTQLTKNSLLCSSPEL
jgi:hypothetical protein